MTVTWAFQKPPRWWEKYLDSDKTMMGKHRAVEVWMRKRRQLVLDSGTELSLGQDCGECV